MSEDHEPIYNLISETVDSNNAMYIHPSESATSLTILVTFDETRYCSWSRGVLHALSVKNYMGFINESIP